MHEVSQERFPDEKELDKITQVQFTQLNKGKCSIDFKKHFNELMKKDDIRYKKNKFLPAPANQENT